MNKKGLSNKQLIQFIQIAGIAILGYIVYRALRAKMGG